MEEYQIDYVIHALDSDKEKPSIFFDIPREMNKFIELDYNVGISTTQIIEQYHNNKLNITMNQIKHTRPMNILKNMQKRIGLDSHSNILEIGIEDDLLSKYVGASNYICLDTNIFNTTKTVNTSPYIALNLSPVYKIFSTFCFDYIIINNPWIMNIYKILDNIENTSKNGIYICNIMDDSSHINEQMFIKRGYAVVKNEYIGFDAYINFE